MARITIDIPADLAASPKEAGLGVPHEGAPAWIGKPEAGGNPPSSV